MAESATHSKSSFSLDPLTSPTVDVSQTDLEEFKRAKKMADFFRTLPKQRLTAAKVVEGMELFNVKRGKLFRLAKRFAVNPTVVALLNVPRAKNQFSRLLSAQEEVIAAARKSFFRKHRDGPITELHKWTNQALLKANLPEVSLATVFRRYAAVSERHKFAARYGKKAANRRFAILKGHTPEQLIPLGRIQIDHTLCDTWLVCPVTNLPVGRPWITVILDECTSVELGFFLTWEGPSAVTCALALQRALFPKDDWLAQRGVKGSWPFFGRPLTIYTDNGSDFTSTAFILGLENYQIQLERRPPGEPQYGGQIERLIGTMSAEMHMLPGAVVRDTLLKDRRPGYQPKKTATMTIEEFETHLIKYFLKYNHSMHRSIEMSPAQKWDSLVAPEHSKAPAPVSYLDNPQKFLLDLLPFKDRTFQRHGFEIDGIKYRDDNLAIFSDLKIGSKVRIKVNSHDLTRVYAFHPERRQYFCIMADNPACPKTLWELRRCKTYNKARNIANDTDSLARAAAILQHEESRQMVQSKKLRPVKNSERSRHSKTLVDAAMPVVTKSDFIQIDSQQPIAPIAAWQPLALETETF